MAKGLVPILSTSFCCAFHARSPPASISAGRAASGVNTLANVLATRGGGVVARRLARRDARRVLPARRRDSRARRRRGRARGRLHGFGFGVEWLRVAARRRRRRRRRETGYPYVCRVFLERRFRDGTRSIPPDAPPVLLVHHSRNTAAKQWDETLSAAITAVRRARAQTSGAFAGARNARRVHGPDWTRTCAFAAEASRARAAGDGHRGVARGAAGGDAVRVRLRRRRGSSEEPLVRLGPPAASRRPRRVARRVRAGRDASRDARSGCEKKSHREDPSGTRQDARAGFRGGSRVGV